MSKHRRALIFLILLFLTAKAQAQSWQKGQDGTYTYRYVPGDPMHARFYILKNGLTVILSVNKSTPRIQTLIGTRAGSNNDPADHTGLAHYLEHLLFKGTDQYGSLDWTKEKPYIDEIENLYAIYNTETDPTTRKATYHQIDSVSGLAAHYAIPNEYDKMMSAIGSQGTNAHTATEETVFEEDIPANEVDQYLAIQAERFRYPVFRLFHTELEAVYEEKNRGLDNDGQKVYYAMLDGLFPHTNYGQQTTIGTIEHLKNPSLTAIREFYNKWYVPNNMSVVMAGDIDPSTIIRKIDAAFSYMQPKAITEYDPTPEQPIAAPVEKNIYGPDAESVTIAFRMPGVNDQHSQVLLEVLADLLSNGSSGLMDLDLNQAQKVQGARANNNTFRLYGMLQLVGKAKPRQSLDDVKELLLGELEKIRKGDFDANLIKAIVDNQKLDILQSMKDNDFRAKQLMGEFVRDKGTYWPESVAFEDNMLKVTKQQVMEFAKNYTNNNYVLVYKHIGKDTTIVKVVKPAITPIFINKTQQSGFLKKILSMPVIPIQPQWIDYDKVIRHSRIGPAKVLYVQNSDNSLFTLIYRFDGHGSWGDKRLPVAAQYLGFLGTKTKTASYFTRAFYNIACSYNIEVHGEETDIILSGLQENFEKAIHLLDDLFQNCQPDGPALADLKARIDKARIDAKLNKDNISKAQISYAIYGPHNPFNDQLSDMELNNLSPNELTNLLHGLSSYTHDIFYYGPMSLNQLKLAVKVPSAFRAGIPQLKFPQTNQTENQVLFTNYDMVQAEVYWVRNTIPYDPSASATIDVFNNYFGISMSGIVFQTIRESKALAYSTFDRYVIPAKATDRYFNIAYVGAQADKLPEAMTSMNQLLDSLPENSVLLADSKTSKLKDLATQRIQPNAYIANYLSAQKLGLHGDHRAVIYAQTGRVQFSDLRALHDKELKDKPYTYCILGAEKNISPEQLAKYGTVKKLTLEELFGY